MDSKDLRCLAGNCGHCVACEDGLLPSDAIKIELSRKKKEAEEWARFKAEGEVLDHLLDQGAEVYTFLSSIGGGKVLWKRTVASSKVNSFQPYSTHSNRISHL